MYNAAILTEQISVKLVLHLNLLVLQSMQNYIYIKMMYIYSHIKKNYLCLLSIEHCSSNYLNALLKVCMKYWQQHVVSIRVTNIGNYL